MYEFVYIYTYLCIYIYIYIYLYVYLYLYLYAHVYLYLYILSGMHPQVSETIYSPDAEKYPGVNIQKMWKTHGFRFGK